MKAKVNKILVVVNPVSGDVKKDPILERLRKLAPPKAKIQIVTTTGQNDRELLGQQMDSFLPDRLVVIGGDGTLHLVTNLQKDSTPVIGIVAAGSTNGFASELQLPSNCDDALKVALGPRTLTVDALLLNGRTVLHTADVGLNAELIQNYDAGGIRGRLGYVIQSVPTLLETKVPYSFSIAVNGQTMEREAIMIVCTHCKRFGTGVIINPDGIIDDGKFELLVFKKLDLVNIAKTLLDTVQMDADFVEVISTTEARVTCNVPIALQIDGESMTPVKELYARTLPKAFEFAIGEKLV